MNTSTQHPNNHAAVPMLSSDGFAHPARLASRPGTRWLALSAVVGPISFTLAWLILGFVSPGFTLFGARISPYSPISTPISGLGLGPTAPLMNTAFVICGAFLLVGVVGVFQSIREIGAVARWSCTALLALTGLGAAMDGIFTLQSFFLHFVGYALACGTPVLSFLVAGLVLRGIPSFRRLGNWLLLASPLTLVLFLISLVTLNVTEVEAGRGVAGLTERIVVVEVVAWFAAMGWLAFRRS
jgi:hypothetical protein